MWLVGVLGDANRVNSSNFNFKTLKFSEKFDNSFSHVFIFGNMFPESHGFVAMPVTICISKILVSYAYLISAPGCEIILPCDRHSNEAATLSKHITKYKHKRKWMVNISENLRIVASKFTRYNVSPKESIFSNFVRCLVSIMMLH